MSAWDASIRLLGFDSFNISKILSMLEMLQALQIKAYSASTAGHLSRFLSQTRITKLHILISWIKLPLQKQAIIETVEVFEVL